MAAIAPAKMKMPSRGWLGFGALVALGALIDTLVRYFPADMPVWMPWEFSWPVFLVTALTFVWYFDGLSKVQGEDRPAWWRIACFVLGLVSIYAVLQTRIDYYAQHMFFVHRWAHFVLHHAGAFGIALGAAGPVMRAGMPPFVRAVFEARPVKAVVDVLQHPAIAPVLFVGLLYFWLIPSIHTHVMLNVWLYDIMNWTMTINGIMFWCLILDKRPKPPARISSLMRALLIIAIELPQMVLGAVLSLTTQDYYPVYRICGRVVEMTAISDQHYGGLIIWLPGTLTSFAAMIVVLVTLRLNEEKAERDAANS
jgi:putative membrane protein